MIVASVTWEGESPFVPREEQNPAYGKLLGDPYAFHKIRCASRKTAP